MAKFSFRKQPRETGLASIAAPYPSTDIKLGAIAVGMIAAPSRFSRNDKWEVRFQVDKTEDDDNQNCGWRWAVMKQQFDTEPEARAWVQEKEQLIRSRYSFAAILGEG